MSELAGNIRRMVELKDEKIADLERRLAEAQRGRDAAARDAAAAAATCWWRFVSAARRRSSLTWSFSVLSTFEV